MNCPFLREAQVRSCQAAPVRKLIVDIAQAPADELCASERHTTCAIYSEQQATSDGPSRCPFLHERLMQYCGVQAVPKLVPYSELSRCGSESHQYCEQYLEMARPRREHTAHAVSGEWQVEGIPVPRQLFFTNNHMWLDVHDSGACHIGIDGFLARLLGEPERVSFLTLRGVNRPGAVLTVRGADWPIAFPNSLLLSGANVYLRSDPSRLASDPYGSGWLFEGWQPPNGTPAHRGLRQGRAAVDWMGGEVRRLSEFVQSCESASGGATLCDGGVPVAGLLDHLTREEVFRLLSSFCGPQAGE